MLRRQFEVNLKEPLHRLLALRIVRIERHLPSPFAAQSGAGKLFTGGRHQAFHRCRHRFRQPIGQPDLHAADAMPDQIDIVLIHDGSHDDGIHIDDMGEHFSSLHEPSRQIFRLRQHKRAARLASDHQLCFPFPCPGETFFDVPLLFFKDLRLHKVRDRLLPNAGLDFL